MKKLFKIIVISGLIYAQSNAGGAAGHLEITNELANSLVSMLQQIQNTAAHFQQNDISKYLEELSKLAADNATQSQIIINMLNTQPNALVDVLVKLATFAINTNNENLANHICCKFLVPTILLYIGDPLYRRVAVDAASSLIIELRNCKMLGCLKNLETIFLNTDHYELFCDTVANLEANPFALTSLVMILIKASDQNLVIQTINKIVSIVSTVSDEIIRNSCLTHVSQLIEPLKNALMLQALRSLSPLFENTGYQALCLAAITHLEQNPFALFNIHLPQTYNALPNNSGANKRREPSKADDRLV